MAVEPCYLAAMDNNPWLSIWLHPRSTIQAIIDRDPGHLVVPLAMLSGISQVLDKASSRNLGDEMGMPALLATCLLGGVFTGVVGLYVFGALARVAGRWLGGTGTSQHLRTAIAWAAVPTAVGLALWIPEYMVFGRDLFSAETPRIDAHPILLLEFALLEFALAMWSLVILCKGVGQVHGFSAWRGLGTIVIAVLLVVVPLLLLAFGVSVLAGG